MATRRSKPARESAPADAETHPYVLLRDITGIGVRGKIRGLTAGQAEEHKGFVRKATKRDLEVAGSAFSR